MSGLWEAWLVRCPLDWANSGQPRLDHALATIAGVVPEEDRSLAPQVTPQRPALNRPIYAGNRHSFAGAQTKPLHVLSHCFIGHEQLRDRGETPTPKDLPFDRDHRHAVGIYSVAWARPLPPRKLSVLHSVSNRRWTSVSTPEVV